MSTVKEPLHPLRTARYLWLGILLCALVGGACFLGGRWSAGRSETAKIDTVVLQNQLSEIRELATVTYAYTNMAQFESSNDFYGVKIPFTTKSFILTYDGTVKAGVDLDGAEVSVSGTTVTITLPEAEILSHEIDEDSMEVFDEKTSIFNPFTVEDFTSFQSDQKAAMEEKALSRVRGRRGAAERRTDPQDRPRTGRQTDGRPRPPAQSAESHSDCADRHYGGAAGLPALRRPDRPAPLRRRGEPGHFHRGCDAPAAGP